MSDQNQKRCWVVRLKCEVTKEVICDNCTEDEARNDPFAYAIEEIETDQSDFTVRSVKPSE